jgi:hypothetical protein
MKRLEDVPETITQAEMRAIVEDDVAPQFGENDGGRVRVDNYRE